MNEPARYNERAHHYTDRKYFSIFTQPYILAESTASQQNSSSRDYFISEKLVAIPLTL